MRVFRLAACLGLVLAGAGPVAALQQTEIASGGLPPIERGYKGRVAAWARAVFAEPRALTGALLSDPVLVRDGTGRLLWLVCLEAVNGAPGALPGGPDRFALGFAPNFFTAPQERRGSTLGRADCQERPLAFRPFPELSQSGGAASVPRRERRPGAR